MYLVNADILVRVAVKLRRSPLPQHPWISHHALLLQVLPLSFTAVLGTSELTAALLELSTIPDSTSSNSNSSKLMRDWTIININIYGSIASHIGSATGIIASSSTFCPHPGRVIRDLFRQLHAVWHGTEAQVYSNHPRETAASSYLAIVAYPSFSAQLQC